MIILLVLDLLKNDLKADHAGLPTDFEKIPMKLLKFMVLDAGEDQENLLKRIEEL